MRKIEFHPVAEIFPLMDDASFRQLVDDIKSNGLREEIWTHDEKIIDGRNRYRACIKAEVEPRFRERQSRASKSPRCWSTLRPIRSARARWVNSPARFIPIATFPLSPETHRSPCEGARFSSRWISVEAMRMDVVGDRRRDEALDRQPSPNPVPDR